MSQHELSSKTIELPGEYPLSHEQAAALLARSPDKKDSKQHLALTWSILPLYLLIGTVLSALYLALYPLLINSGISGDLLQQALPGLFPWLPSLYWTRAFPGLATFLRGIAWFDPATEDGRANLQLVVLGLVSLLMFLGAYLANRVTRRPLTRIYSALLFCCILLVAAACATALVFAPVRVSMASQELLLSGLSGRLLVFHGLNPYLAAPDSVASDPLWVTLGRQVPSSLDMARLGPFWLDGSLLISLLARDSVANVLLGYRLPGLVIHLLNAVLIWQVVGRLKAEMRVAATILYAWNPLILLFGVYTPHLELAVIFLILLAFFAFQRKMLMFSWICLVLAALVNVQYVFLLPLALPMLARGTSRAPLGQRILWWFGAGATAVLVVLLVYAPYWQDGVIAQITNARQLFWPDRVANSLAEALLNLPVHLPAFLSLLLNAHAWALAALILAGLFFLASLWLANAPEVLALCSAWIALLLLLLMPFYWPWLVIVPLVLALCAESHSTRLLTSLLMLGGLLAYYFWQWSHPWTGQALVAVWLPLILWGWMIFFRATWRMNRARSLGKEVA
jgi:hypothetical protein